LPRVGDVGLQRENVAAERDDFLLRACQPLRPTRKNGNSSAASRECQRGCPSDTR
jgi:hypothetical protein